MLKHTNLIPTGIIKQIVDRIRETRNLLTSASGWAFERRLIFFESDKSFFLTNPLVILSVDDNRPTDVNAISSEQE